MRLTTATLAILGISGAIYEQVNARRDRIRYPQIGRSYYIGGRSLNLYCTGTGSPAVIFEGTQGTAGYAWAVIQEGVAGFTRACWYDRAGYGWSDPGPFPNHADSIARDLHKLLHAAAIGPPYVLVGHALGSFAARVFAGYYPDDMAGLVLLDPFNEDTTIRVHNHIEAFRPFGVWFARAAGHVGWWRLMGRSPGPPPQGWTADRWAIAFAMGWQAKTVAARIGEPPLWVSGELARAERPSLSGLPLMILSGEKQPEMVDGEDNQQELQRHEELAHLSRRGVHEVIAGSGDWNPFNTPGVVIEAVRGIVQESGLKK
jgi:pimeloyl-ACP methyl ester carboxylesterase